MSLLKEPSSALPGTFSHAKKRGRRQSFTFSRLFFTNGRRWLKAG